jgi:hypothetical protein
MIDKMILEQEKIDARIALGRRLAEEILSSPALPFADLTPAQLPNEPGLYVITASTGDILRAGRTDAQTLRDRVYRNHLMGNQSGNLRAQLVREGVCDDMESAKDWIRQNCAVRVVTSAWLNKAGLDIRWSEHFILAILQPIFSN